MTDAELNRFIAIEIVGWDEDIKDIIYAPAYTSNVMLAYEAEELISAKGLQPAYERALLEIVERDAGGLGRATPFHLIHATARQRCEGMLETVKKNKR